MRDPTFAGADLAQIEPVDLASARDIRSAHLIAHIADSAGADREAAAAVVDGFWDFVADVRGNYHYSAKGVHVNPRTLGLVSGGAVRIPKAWLVIPHFGTFHVRRTRARKYPGLRLSFRSRREGRFPPNPAKRKGGLFSRLKSLLSAMPEPKVEEAPVAHATTTGLLGSWVEYVGGREGLSTKRRMAFDISRSSGLDLRLTTELLDHLFKAMLAVFDRAARERAQGPQIHWARRGVMLPDLHYGPRGGVYRFRCSPGFARRIANP